MVEDKWSCKIRFSIDDSLSVDVILSQMQQAMPPAMANGVSVNVDMGAPGLFHPPQSNLGLYHESTFDTFFPV